MIKADDIFRISMRQVVRTRPLAATLSIAFGIAAFIALGVLGEEIRIKLNNSFLIMGGVNMIRIVMDDDRYPGSPPHYFEEDTVTALRGVAGVQVVSASASWSPPFNQTIGTKQYPLYLVGIDQYYVAANYLDVVAGRNLTDQEVELGERVALLGYQASVEIFGSPQEALGKHIYINRNDTARIVGVIQGPLMGDSTAWSFAPYTMTLDRGLSATPELDRIYILAQSWETIPELAKALRKCIQDNQVAPHVAVRYAEAQFTRIRDTFFWLSFLLWMAIALSLLLGGFGIWSGTFAAVRGRTHEIGLQKAMGATNHDIMNLFLCEALIKALLGGLVGLLLGTVGVAVGVRYLGAGLPLTQLLLCGAGSLLFSALLGISGGIYPASRASRMDVVDSLRFE